jgi:uncharacterized protein YqgC (DUF456 family)
MAIDIVLLTTGGICMIVGIIGCVLPVLPGPILCYAGLILLQFSSKHPFSITFLVIYAILTVLVAGLDYVIPIYGTKKLEGSKYGIWGSAVGLVVGTIFFFPFGILVGPMLGAFIGELISGKTKDKALKSALGSFLGFLASTAVKLLLSLLMAYHFVINVINLYTPV